MTLRRRYTLIVLGAIIFAIAAPVMVLGIRGITYDFSNKRFVKTGILVAKAEPRDATLVIEGNGVKRERKGSSTIRFLAPGDYNVSFSREGFHTWQKRLTIRGGLVTWANEGRDRIYLLPAAPKLVEETETLEPQTPEPKDEYKYLFTRTGDKLTLIQRNGGEKILASNIPLASDAKIYPLSNGLLFITLNRTLYQVKEHLEYIAEGVDSVTWHGGIGRVVYTNTHEVNFYNPYDAGSNQRQLLLRTSDAGGNFCIIPELGYALRVFDKTIKAVELDGRDKRNSYDILNSNFPLDIISCDKEGKEILVKENGIYKTYSLR